MDQKIALHSDVIFPILGISFQFFTDKPVRFNRELTEQIINPSSIQKCLMSDGMIRIHYDIPKEKENCIPICGIAALYANFYRDKMTENVLLCAENYDLTGYDRGDAVTCDSEEIKNSNNKRILGDEHDDAGYKRKKSDLLQWKNVLKKEKVQILMTAEKDQDDECWLSKVDISLNMANIFS